MDSDSFSSYEAESKSQRFKAKEFISWVFFSQLLGLASVVLVAVWMGMYRGGFDWHCDPEKEFNYHPLCMVIGMVFLYAEALLVYRVFRNGDNKFSIKVLHTSLHVFALIFAGVGLKAVFHSHLTHNPPLPNLYSLHSWLGLISVIFFTLQWLLSFLTYLCPGLKKDLRALYKPVHVYCGIGIFLMSSAAAITGIKEKGDFKTAEGTIEINVGGILANILGLTLLALALVVCYIVINPNYKKEPPLSEEREQLTK